MTALGSEPLHLRLRRALRAPGAPPVEVRETHVSWVFLTRERAYKLKKPVHFGFIDQSSPEARRRGCEEEVRVNAVLAPDVVLGVRAVVPSGDSYALDAPSSPAAVDWVVEMRRFDEDRTMAALIARNALPDGAVPDVAARIAAFHAETPAYDAPGHAAATREEVDDNIAELVAAEDEPTRALPRIARFVAAFVARHEAQLTARGRDGRVRDGHGDLRAEHVVLEDGQVTIVDRLEFDPELRRVDVADDLAFLVMDLRALGAPAAAEQLIDAYRSAGGDPGDDALVAFFAAHRALVRAKVALLRAGQRTADTERARDDESAAADLIRLAEHMTWAARGRRVVLVHGPPASGKTWLATALSACSGLPVVSTDAVRKELLGVAATEHAPPAAYAPAQRRAVYAEVGRRAAAALEHGSVIVDATLGDPAVRGALLEILAPEAARLVAIRCHAERATLLRRATDRAAHAADMSDAGRTEVEWLSEAFMPLTDIPAGQRIDVDTERDVEDLIDDVGSWIDQRP